MLVATHKPLLTPTLNTTNKLDILNVVIISPELCAHYFLVIPILGHDSPHFIHFKSEILCS